MVKKTPRYFEQKTDDDSKASKAKKPFTKVETYHVNPKPQRWGRHNADRFEGQPKRFVKIPNPKPKFKGRVKISKKLLTKYDGNKKTGILPQGVRTTLHQTRFARKEKNIKFAQEFSARTEVLLTEDAGFLEVDAGETSTQFTQEQIAKSVDITAATKHFELRLTDFGPYRAKYTRNGRHLLLGGQKGHVAALDWVTKKLHCETNVMESVHDISWLHIETMFAVAQKSWVYIYDNQGIELHCMKQMNKVTRMEFLPYHFLLASCSDVGYLTWLDISIGKVVNQFNTKLGRLTLMSQNPWNAVLCVGHAKGVVSMWGPNTNEPLAKLLCHKAPLTAVHVDPQGLYMATAAVNREMKIWDVRALKGPVQDYKLASPANNLAFSQKDLLAVGMGNIVEVYSECCATAAKRPYLRHRCATPIGNLSFCPFEDVLGVATASGFTSMLTPGAGEANYDAFEANPFQSKAQRQEAEVKALLEKIQPEMITLDPAMIASVDRPTLKDKIEAKEKLLHVRAPKIKYEPRNKAKGKGGSAKMAKNKKIVQEKAKQEFIKSTRELKPQKQASKESLKPVGILDRFLPKKTK